MKPYKILMLLTSLFSYSEFCLAADFAENPLFCSQFVSNATTENLSLNFPEPTPVKDIVKFVKEHSNIDIAMSRNINGNLQIFAQGSKDIKSKCEEFLAALRNLNLTIVPQNGIFSLMKIRDAEKSSLPIFFPDEIVPETNQIVRKLVAIKHGNINFLKSILIRFTQTRQIMIEPANNILIITESGLVIKSLLKMIDLFDLPCDKNCKERVQQMNVNLELDSHKHMQKLGRDKK